MFEKNIIQPKIKDYFGQIINNNHLAHAYLFHGFSGSGKTAFALALAKALNCSDMFSQPCDICPSCIKINNGSHPDIRLVMPLSSAYREKEEKTGEILKEKYRNPYRKIEIKGHTAISIESIREIKNEAKYAAYEAKIRFFIISGIEFMTREAANSFLKLLEEPPEHIIFILTTNDYSSVMDTIRSRCQPIKFPVFSEQEINQLVKRYYPDFTEDIAHIIRLSKFDCERVFQKIEKNNDDLRNEMLNFLRAATRNNWQEINEVIEKITSKRDKNIVVEFLDLLQLWMADSMHMFYTSDNQLILNADMMDTLIKFSNHYGTLDYEKADSLIEQTLSDVKGNAHPAMALSNLAIELKKILVKQVKENVNV